VSECTVGTRVGATVGRGGGGPWSAAPRSSPFMSPSTAASTAARPSPAVTPPAGAWCARRSTSTSAATTPGAELNAVLFCAQLFCAQPPPLPSVFSSTCHPASPAHQRPREGRARARPRARQRLPGRREKDNHPLASQCGGGPAIPPPPPPPYRCPYPCPYCTLTPSYDVEGGSGLHAWRGSEQGPGGRALSAAAMSAGDPPSSSPSSSSAPACRAARALSTRAGETGVKQQGNL
jgi:hypothetical protein